MRDRKVKQNYRDLPEAIRDIALIINNEPTYTLTLDTGTLSTIISNPVVGINSVMSFMATTANGAAENLYITNRGKGVFTVNHANTATTDRTFGYTVFG